MTRPEIVSRAIKAAGGVAALASKIGITPEAVSQWRRIPHKRAAVVSEATGIPARELCPDLAAQFAGESA